MKHEEISLQTKKKLANSLKKLMISKPLNKITITEIIKDCDVNRKTFYYHFVDIYDLVKWILEQEAINVIKEFDFIHDYKDAILFVIQYVEDNAHILNCVYDTMGREEMRRFLYVDCIEAVERIVNHIEESMNVTAEPTFKHFICELYTEGLAGILIEWFKNPQKRNKEEMVDYLTVIFCSAIPQALKDAPQNKKSEHNSL